MSKTVSIKTISGLAAVALLMGCTGPKPVAYSGLASASYLKPNPGGPVKTPYTYTSQVNWQSYSKVILDSVTIYDGADNQFGSVSNSDKTELAQYMQKRFTDELGKHFTIVTTPDAGTLRIHLTLTGAILSKFPLSTALHLDIAGNLYNATELALGGPGAMTGSVMYSVEIYDAQSNQLLAAYVTKQYPNSENIIASFGTLGAAKTGIGKGAKALTMLLEEGV
jgi:hypothetical protein